MKLHRQEFSVTLVPNKKVEYKSHVWGKQQQLLQRCEDKTVYNEISELEFPNNVKAESNKDQFHVCLAPIETNKPGSGLIAGPMTCRQFLPGRSGRSDQQTAFIDHLIQLKRINNGRHYTRMSHHLVVHFTETDNEVSQNAADSTLKRFCTTHKLGAGGRRPRCDTLPPTAKRHRCWGPSGNAISATVPLPQH